MYLIMFVTFSPKAYVKLFDAFHHCPIKVVKQKMSSASVPACFNGVQIVTKDSRALSEADYIDSFMPVTPLTNAVIVQMTMVSTNTSVTPVMPSSTG